jgi:hypothetical protein
LQVRRACAIPAVIFGFTNTRIKKKKKKKKMNAAPFFLFFGVVYGGPNCQNNFSFLWTDGAQHYVP